MFLTLLVAAALQTASAPTFDVVSVKPTPGQPVNSGFRRAAPGVLNATNASLKLLIEFAYDVRDDQLSGGPSWLDSARFEVLAKPPDGETPAEAGKLLKPRVRSLLADRFHLELHRDTKILPTLTLTVAKNGPKGLHASTAAEPDFINNGHHLNCQRLSMAMLAKGFLAPQTGRTVTDQTGISGEFDFTLDWAPDTTEASTSQFPSLFQALEEQLGLKLEPSHGPVEVLVIDRAERPAGN